MPTLSNNLELVRCPHCKIDMPNLSMLTQVTTQNHKGQNIRHWFIYRCMRCGGAVTASAGAPAAEVMEVFPSAATVDPELPERAKNFLKQAMDSLHTPAGAVMLAARTVDAMLKEKGDPYRSGSLFSRIDKAVENHLLTEDMGEWAHSVRLDANDQRHADEEAEEATPEDAQRSIDFVTALGLVLFVLPARIRKGLKGSDSPPSPTGEEKK